MREKKNTLLVVDEELQTPKMLNILLDSAHYKIIESSSGKQAIRLCVSVKPDLILLELALPDMDGKEVISAIREWSQVPIIILSVRSEDEEVVTALDLGADDYVMKPFNAEILRARINATLRKSVIQAVGEPELRNGPIRIDLVRHQVFMHDRIVAFTPKEYDLLRYFIINRGKMLTHRDILKEVWGITHGDDKQYLRVFVRQLREKIEENPAAPKFIITEPGIGYRMEIL